MMMKTDQPLRNRFERHPKLTLSAILIVLTVMLLAAAEVALRAMYGLGNPVLYRSSPLYGYRLQPNQLVHRIGAAEVRVNNLGLRADGDWDSVRTNKVLFLGNSVTFGGTYIGTTELFSHLAVQGLGDYAGGNAGVNGWGIENIHALVVEDNFTPASVYVSVLQEMDFYRGLSRLAGKPFWTRKPVFALQELLHHFYLDRFDTMYEGHDRFVTPNEYAKTVERAVLRLRELDDFLKSKGYIHLIYMSTNTYELFEGRQRDSLVYAALDAHDIAHILIAAQPELRDLSSEEQRGLFYDWNHLSVEGHRLWAEIIRKDLERVLAE